MADSVVTSLIQHLSRLLSDHVNLRSGVKAKIRSLHNELEFIDEFLKRSEGKRNDEQVKIVVRQIRDVAHEAEDVIDTYIVNINIQRSRNIAKKLLHCTSHEMMLRNVDATIESIKRIIDDIYNNKDRYGIGEGEFQSGGDSKEEAAELLRTRRRDVEEEEVVGLVHDSSIVIKQLLETNSCLSVVSIIGMGGLGKTTLARKIYNNNEVKELFPYRAWGYVSNEYRAKELLLSILQCLMPSMLKYQDLSEEELKNKDYQDLSEKELKKKKYQDLSEEELKKVVREYLNKKKYLVVLDDIWKTQVWNELQGAFPDDNMGSRILLTSRIKEVASYAGTTLAYNLSLLNKEDSWKLFCKKVFPREDCPSNLKDLGISIVNSCSGLPLAIVVLAGLVAKKDKSQREWLRIKDHVSWHLAQGDDIKVMDILKLSYDNLPRRLKPCFLCFGIYPEDYEISVRQLIQLWMAEGLIQPSEIGTSNAPELEDIGEYYLDELADRNLVQVASRRSDGGVKTCQIHDLLHDFCILESKTNKFMEVCSELDMDKCNPRRMSVHYKTHVLYSPTKYNQSHARSLFLFGKGHYQKDRLKDYEQIRQSFKLARVLHLEGLTLNSPFYGLKTMIHLRYLRLELYDKSRISLHCIGSLWNLETLHFGRGTIAAVPSGIWKLKQLRHFYLRDSSVLGMSKRANSETLLNLQTLSVMPLYPQLASMLTKNCFPKLTKLGLQCAMFAKHHWRSSPCLSWLSLHHLSELHTLKIVGSSDLSFDAKEITSNLFSSNLTKITLKYFFELDSKILGRLPSLRILKLARGTIRDSLNSADGEFPQLQVFEMDYMDFQTWILEKGAMPCLSRLLIRSPLLTELPEELWSLTALREVHVIDNFSKRDDSLFKNLQDVKLNNGCKLIISSQD